MITKPMQRVIDAMKTGAVLTVSRDRVALNGDQTVPRRVFDRLLEQELVRYDGKWNNFTMRYVLDEG